MKSIRIIVLVLVLSLVVPLTALAQDPPAPGEGGLLVEGSTRSSADLRTLMPFRCSGVDCSNPGALMFPGLIGVDPETQNYGVGLPTDLATAVEVSEDGLTYTVTIRDDMTWNDGEPVTTEDVYFGWRLTQEDPSVVGLSSSYSIVAQNIVDAEIIDDTTITFTLESASCEGLRYVATVPPTPAHGYGWSPDVEDDFDYSTLLENDLDLNPSITAGPFQFNRIEPGTAIYLEADLSYSGGFTGDNEGTLPEGFVFLDVPDEVVMVERFLAGEEINMIREPDGNVFNTIIENNPDNTLNAPGRIWHYMAINLADPTNPQNGLDEDGNPIPQGHHPIFGDVRVRQAIQHGINIDEIINGPLDGNATAMVSGTIPTAFTIHPELERRAYDLDAARALLDEAGWVASGDPLVDGGDGLRVATADAMYAEEGTEFVFELMNVGDIRGDVSVVVQDQLAQLGIDVVVTVMDFNAMYDDNMGQQTYDAAIAGWRGGLPFNPDQRNFFGAENDIYGDGYGFNFTSWYNEEFEEINEQIATLPGCDPEERAALAHRAQEIMWEDQPYIWLYALNSLYSASPEVQNFEPFPNFYDWNADSLFVAQ